MDDVNDVNDVNDDETPRVVLVLSFGRVRLRRKAQKVQRHTSLLSSRSSTTPDLPNGSVQVRKKAHVLLTTPARLSLSLCARESEDVVRVERYKRYPKTTQHHGVH